MFFSIVVKNHGVWTKHQLCRLLPHEGFLVKKGKQVVDKDFTGIR